MAILIDAEQLSKHKYVGIEYNGIEMGIPASAINVLAYKWGWNDALDSVESFAPIVDTETVRHGHWIRSSDGYWDECSKCHANIDISMGSGIYNADGDKVEHDWCPHCGAKMDEVKHDTCDVVCDASYLYADNRIETWFDEMPTVDSVEVVRCKDCKHNYHNMIPGGEAEYGCTKCIELPITADFYCALGERKDDK